MSGSIGPVETKFCRLDSPFELECGESLPSVTVAYEQYGELNSAKDNAIVLFHALSGSQHAAGVNTAIDDPVASQLWNEDMHLGWWDDYIGPGKALDTDHFSVICANYIGGCYGSTGPASVNPETGEPYGGAFPHLTVTDVVRSQVALLDQLGIDQCHALIGPSVGGMLALNFASLYPARVRYVVPISSSVKTTVLNRLILLEQILAIENDPHFHGGDYYDRPDKPTLGLALARMISHKTFVHLDTIERRARKEIIQPDDQLDWYQLHDKVESYILHQGKSFVKRFDANTYLRVCELWSKFDPLDAGDAASYADLFARSRDAGHRYLVFSIDSDFCFYPEEQAELVGHLEEAEVETIHITVHSNKGHDSFLLEPHLFAPHLSHLLNGHH